MEPRREVTRDGEILEWGLRDRSSPFAWGPGTWDEEPDKVTFRTKVGFPGMIRRSPSTGVWCGYAAVGPGHPLHPGSRDTEVDAFDVDCIDVHGGVTYGATCVGEVCHVPVPGESDDVFWVGFDCGHYDDVLPAMPEATGSDATYKTAAYARAEVERLAEQLEEMQLG